MIEEEGGEISSMRDVSSIIPLGGGISAAYKKSHSHREAGGSL